MISLASDDRALIVAPHPDDESLATGGLIQRIVAAGARVRVLFLTNGENNPWPQRFVERIWRISLNDRIRWGKRRRAEAMAALTELGAKGNVARFLHLPDQGLTRLLMQGGRSIVTLLAEELADFRPTLVVGPAGRDTHPDHSAAHVLLQLALRRNGTRGIRVLDYVVHGKPFTRTPSSVALHLPPREIRDKLSAIQQHATQIALSRRRFCAYAAPLELFHVLDPLRTEHPTHPICAASVQDDCLNLSVKHSWPAFATRRILLAIEAPAGPPTRWSLPLPMFSGEAKLRDERTGETVGTATARWGSERTELRIPLADLPTPAAIFAKLAGSGVFFDQAGWRDVPTGKHPAHFPPLPDRTVEIQALVSSFYSRPQPSTADGNPNPAITLQSTTLGAISGTVEMAPSEESRRAGAELRERHFPQANRRRTHN